jgi:hypothetical protein
MVELKTVIMTGKFSAVIRRGVVANKTCRHSHLDEG